MSNLAKYEGNFVKYADSFEFNSSGSAKTFDGAIDGLNLSLSCDVAIFPGKDGRTIVEIDSDEPEKFKVCERDGVVFVENEADSSGGVVINNFGGGRTISVSSGGVSIINGQVYVNGKRVDADQSSSEPPKRKSRVRIYAQHGIELEADLSGVSVLASKVVFDRAKVSVCGQSTVGLASKNIDIKLSGQGDSYVVCQGGELEAKVSGQGSITVKGDYSEVEANVSGMGEIRTIGTCNGNYRANLSGMGSINHSGTVKGRVRKNVSGMGRISGL